MGFDVKNTTIISLMDLFCPHYCIKCGKLGEILCGNCKNYNVWGEINYCLKCGLVIEGSCKKCRLPFDWSFVVGMKDRELLDLVAKYKYKPIRALSKALAEILDKTVPFLPENTVIVPMPTAGNHVRMRGFDHARLVARRLAKLRGVECLTLVDKVNNFTQVGMDAATRRRQARLAYRLRGKILEGKEYLVLDDICTTGASIEEVCRVLREGGARKIGVVVLVKS